MRSLVLLRGVNVGDRNQIATSELTEWFLAAEFSSVRTYIHSDNVVLEHPRRTDVDRVVHDAVAEHTGYDLALIVRTCERVARRRTREPLPRARSNAVARVIPRHRARPRVARTRPASGLDPRGVLRRRSKGVPAPAHGRGTRDHGGPRLALIARATTRHWNTVSAPWPPSSRTGGPSKRGVGEELRTRHRERPNRRGPHPFLGPSGSRRSKRIGN